MKLFSYIDQHYDFLLDLICRLADNVGHRHISNPDNLYLGMQNQNLRVAATGEDNFLVHVTRVRSEIRDKFLHPHKLLQDREADLLAELQELEDEFIGDKMRIRIEKLNLSKDLLIKTLTDNPDREVLEKSRAPVDASILELERKLQNVKDTYKSVTLEWGVDLEDVVVKS